MLYNFSKCIANILKTYVKNKGRNTKNSNTFSHCIRNVSIEDDEMMLSFDVTSLQTNIPIYYSLNIIKDYVNNNDQFTNKTGITQDKLLESDVSFLFNILCYHQST